MWSHRRIASRRLPVVRSAVESLDRRVFLSVAEPNNTFDTATTSTDPETFYGTTNFNNADSVNPASDPDDFYKFYTLYGPTHLHANLDAQSASADLYVYDGNKNLVASSTLSGNQSETIDVDLAGFQYYYVRVHAVSGTDNYSLFTYSDYAGSSLGTARDLGTSLGQTNSKYQAYNQIFLNDYLDYRDNVDLFKFAMEANGTVNLRRLNPSNDGGPLLQTDLVLYNSSGTPIAYGVTNGDGLDISNVSLTKGTYYVGVHQSVGAGQYSLRIVSDYAGVTTSTARDLGNVTNTSREDIDMVGGPFGFPVYEDALDLYKIKLDGSAGHPTSPLTLNLDVNDSETANFDADLFIAQDTNGDGTIQNSERLGTSAAVGDDKLTYAGLPAGTYYVGVLPHAGKFYTTYTLDLDSDVDGTGDYRGLGLANTFGTITTATTKTFSGGFGVSQGDITDYYKFTVNGTATITANVARDAANSRETWTPGLQIVQDKNGNGLFDNLGESLAASSTGSLTYTLAAGTYYLALGSSGGQLAYTGSAAITPVTADDPDDTINKVKNSSKNVVATGGNVQFSLDNLKDVDIVRYVATAGQTIGFDIDGRNNTTPNTYLRLFNSSGTQLASNDNQLAPGETGSTVSSYFKYTFTTGGTYYLGVSLSPNTGYNPNTGTGDVNGGGPTGDYTLTALKLAKISGTVFKDNNSNGKLDAGEPGYGGVSVYLDDNNDAKPGSDEPTTVTDASGNYAFYVPAGTWKVRQVVPGGRTQSLPTDGGGISVTASAGGSYTGKNFGDEVIGIPIHNAAINGKVFNDKNLDGIIGGGEDGYEGWVVYLDADNDGVKDPGETTAITDSFGNYKFSSLAAGTYKVRAVPISNLYAQVYPKNNFGQQVTLTNGQNATDKNFGFVMLM